MNYKNRENRVREYMSAGVYGDKGLVDLGWSFGSLKGSMGKEFRNIIINNPPKVAAEILSEHAARFESEKAVEKDLREHGAMGFFGKAFSYINLGLFGLMSLPLLFNPEGWPAGLFVLFLAYIAGLRPLMKDKKARELPASVREALKGDGWI